MMQGADMESRVTAHTINGVACILPGLHRHDGDFTMPSRCRVAVCLNQEWIRPATKEETAQHGKWYHLLNFKPAAVIHSNGKLARLEDTVGMYGQHITVLAEKIPVPPCEEVPCADVDDIPTPPTPPPVRNDRQYVELLKLIVCRSRSQSWPRNG